MASFESTSFRKKNFKKGVDQEDARRRREETSIQIRKEKKEAQLSKRRAGVGGGSFAGGGGGGGGGVPGMPMTMPPEPPVPTSVTPTSTKGKGMDGAVDPEMSQRLQLLMQGVMSNDPKLHLEATTQFRKLLSIERSPPIQAVIDTGVVPRFVQFLQCEHEPGLQFEAAWALTNIASGTSVQTRVVIDNGAIPIFCRLLVSDNDDVREQAVWALGNIAGDSPDCRDRVLNQGAMNPLLAQLNEHAKLSMLRNATWTLSNFCRGKPQPDFTQVQPALPILSQLIYSTDADVLTDACWALSYLSDGPTHNIQAVIESGVARRLVELLSHESASVQTPALRTLGNIVTGDDPQTQTIINCQALPPLLGLLTHQKKGIRKEACWTISNITAGNQSQIQSVLDANMIPPLIHMLQHDEFDIRKEAAWAISNTTSGGSPEQIMHLVHQGCIPPLCQLLQVHDAKVVMVALEGLENILKLGEATAKAPGATNSLAACIDDAGGLVLIEKLQEHQNEEIYTKAISILEKYFGVDQEDVGFAPPVDPNTQQFMFGGQPPPPGPGGGGGGQAPQQFSFGPMF